MCAFSYSTVQHRELCRKSAEEREDTRTLIEGLGVNKNNILCCSVFQTVSRLPALVLRGLFYASSSSTGSRKSRLCGVLLHRICVYFDSITYPPVSRSFIRTNWTSSAVVVCGVLWCQREKAHSHDKASSVSLVIQYFYHLLKSAQKSRANNF